MRKASHRYRQRPALTIGPTAYIPDTPMRKSLLHQLTRQRTRREAYPLQLWRQTGTWSIDNEDTHVDYIGQACSAPGGSRLRVGSSSAVGVALLLRHVVMESHVLCTPVWSMSTYKAPQSPVRACKCKCTRSAKKGYKRKP
jgi:hypothetical protein